MSTFLYFAYGSNLLQERIHVNNPSATFTTIGKLEDYKLCFRGSDDEGTWHGPGADIQPLAGSQVWGVIWQLDMHHQATLDSQEGVEYKVYKPIDVPVKTVDGEELICRTYQQCRDTLKGKPSPHYLDVLVKGALQHGLPSNYIDWMKRIETNGYSGKVQLYDDIMKKYNENNSCSK